MSRLEQQRFTISEVAASAVFSDLSAPPQDLSCAPSRPLPAFPPIPLHHIPVPCWLRSGQKIGVFI